jgi:hypothetical protein
VDVKNNLNFPGKITEPVKESNTTINIKTDPNKLNYLDFLKPKDSFKPSQVSSEIKTEPFAVNETKQTTKPFEKVEKKEATPVEANESGNNDPLGRGLRASRDGLQASGVTMGFGKTGWVDNTGFEKGKDSQVVLGNFSSFIGIKSWKGEKLSGNIGLAAGTNLEFVTVDGVGYQFTHFDGTFGLNGSVSKKLSDNNILKLSTEILHESTHLGDHAMEHGLQRHNDSAEWVGAEVSYQHINSPVEFEIYGGADKYFHSMPSHPLNYKLEAGGVVSVFDRKLSLSGTVDMFNAGNSSRSDLLGDIEGNHFGGRIKLLYSPTGNGTGFSVAYDAGADNLGQNIGQLNNRVLVGFQLKDFSTSFFD